jgi:hypothetical protein
MSTQSRIGAAAVAAIAFAVAGTTVVGHKIPDQHWGTRGAVLDVAFAIGLIAAAFVLPALSELVGVGRVGRIGTRLAQIGQAAMAVESIASTIHGGNTLGPVFVLGLVGSVIGLAMVAIDGIRAGLARGLAVVPLLGLLVGIAAGDQGGAVVLGVAWAVVAVRLSRRGTVSAAVASA